MNRGGSFRRRLSSLRGAWRWSTGYLFRKSREDVELFLTPMHNDSRS